MRLRSKAAYGITTQPLVALLLCASSLSAQTSVRTESAAHPARTIVGRVLDEASRALPGVEVRAVGGASTVTDSSGRFVLTSLPYGVLQLEARKVGFDSSSTTVADTLGSSPEIPQVSIILRRTHRLHEIVVEGQAFDRALWDLGFYHRRKVASGVFFDPDAIEHFGGDGLGSLVRQAPRVDVRRIDNADHAFSAIAGRACRMNIFIDGMFQRVAMPGPTGSEGMGLNDLIGFHEIAAVEVYPRASSVPTQFMRMGPPAGPQGISSHAIPLPGGMKSGSPSQGENQDAACGAIVIWTKSPRNSKPATGGP